jgi:hypothetical protein
MLLALFIGANFAQDVDPGEEAGLQEVYDYANRHFSDDDASAGKIMVLTINFGDFYCQKCLADFLDFIDLLDETAPHERIPVLLLVRQNDFQELRAQRRIIDRWADANNIRHPTMLDDHGILDRAGLTKTGILIYDNGGKILHYDTFPMGNEKHKIILTIINRSVILNERRRE